MRNGSNGIKDAIEATRAKDLLPIVREWAKTYGTKDQKERGAKAGRLKAAELRAFARELADRAKARRKVHLLELGRPACSSSRAGLLQNAGIRGYARGASRTSCNDSQNV